jgi:hypothetical protein
VVYGAFDGLWKPRLPIFEGPSMMKHQIVVEYLEYLYGKQHVHWETLSLTLTKNGREGSIQLAG